MVRHLFDVELPKPKASTSWLKPYWDEWKRIVGGSPHGAELAQRMKRLEKEYGREKVIAHFQNYLSRVSIQHASLQRFETTFMQHGESSQAIDPRGNLATARRILDGIEETGR